MSGKKVELLFSEKYDGWWMSWGNETFYDENRELRTWKDVQSAVNWLTENHPELKFTLLTPGEDVRQDPPDLQIPLF